MLLYGVNMTQGKMDDGFEGSDGIYIGPSRDWVEPGSYCDIHPKETWCNPGSAGPGKAEAYESGEFVCDQCNTAMNESDMSAAIRDLEKRVAALEALSKGNTQAFTPKSKGVEDSLTQIADRLEKDALIRAGVGIGGE